MSTLRFQQVRFCVQCKDPQPLKCARCMKHPDRKPQIVELYDWPEILATGPCGCLLIACQAPGCSNKRWRYPRLHSKTGKSRSETFCCSPKCATAVANAAKSISSVQATCAYCGKDKTVQAAVFKLRRHVFCDASHHYMWIRRMAHESKQVAIAAAESDNDAALLWCGRCRDIVSVKLIDRRLHIYQCEKGHRLDVGLIEKEHIREASRVAVVA